MPEILVISGKGGTGKTSLTAAFAHLSDHPVICDLDVDAPDLHLLLNPTPMSEHDFYAGNEAVIQSDRCCDCGICSQVCRFGAVRPEFPTPVIDPLRCEGCKVCVEFCPDNAIAFLPKHCGTWFQSGTRFGPMLHAQLFPGQENSGRLVALLRQKAKETRQARNGWLVLSDGPPGIGCPVISALSGVDLAVIVTEPTPSGLHDFKRIAALCDHFKIPVAVIVNKSDLNDQTTEQIASACDAKGYQIAARLPHDAVFVHAMVQKKTVTEFTDSSTASLIRQAWEKILALMVQAKGIDDKMVDNPKRRHAG
jgi:MinD superfamily P-loop ATPase